MSSETPTISLLGYKIYAGHKEYFSSDLKGAINTISPHSYIVARKDEHFMEALKASDYIIPDGVGIVMAARVLEGKKIRKIAGSDLHKVLLKKLDEKKGSCFYLGSSDKTLEIIKNKVNREYPGIRVGSFSPPFIDMFSDADNNEMINKVNSFVPDVLFVGMTAPKQEKWVFANRDRIKVPLICSIGAVFDFYAGTVKRPGQFWISIGLEWLPRLIREPRRLWRRTIVSTPLFIWYVMREKLRLTLKV